MNILMNKDTAHGVHPRHIGIVGKLIYCGMHLLSSDQSHINI